MSYPRVRVQKKDDHDQQAWALKWKANDIAEAEIVLQDDEGKIGSGFLLEWETVDPGQAETLRQVLNGNFYDRQVPG